MGLRRGRRTSHLHLARSGARAHRLPVDSEAVVTSLGRLALPLANLPFSAFLPDGSRVAGAMAALHGPDAGTFFLTVVGYQGNALFDRRYAFGPEPLTREAADSVIGESVVQHGVEWDGS